MNTPALIVSIVALLVGFVSGKNWEHAFAVAEVAQIKGASATASATATAEASRQQTAVVTRGNELAVALVEEQRQTEQQTAINKRKIPHVTTIYRPAPAAPARALPECIVTAGAVSVWNDAIAPRPDPAETGASPGGNDVQADADGAVDSGVRLPDLLAHHADYARRCRGIESQLNRLIDYIEFDPAAAQ